MASRRNQSVGAYEVSGPNVENRSAQSIGAALSLAQNFACSWSKPGTWYVRLMGKVLWHVERDEQGVVITRPV